MTFFLPADTRACLIHPRRIFLARYLAARAPPGDTAFSRTGGSPVRSSGGITMIINSFRRERVLRRVAAEAKSR